MQKSTVAIVAVLLVMGSSAAYAGSEAGSVMNGINVGKILQADSGAIVSGINIK